MLVLFCIQIVQTNINESNWREKKNKQLFNANEQKRKCELAKKVENFNS
jgi:hypothetical protein